MRTILLIVVVLTLAGCGRHRRMGEFSGFPRHRSEDFGNTSLCKTTDDVLYSKPCAMVTVVSEEFYRGYQDGLNGRRIKVFGRGGDYQSGHDLGESDRGKSVARKFEVKK